MEKRLWARKVFLPVLANVLEPDVVVPQQRFRHARQQHLSAVRGRADTRGAMDLQADLPQLSVFELAGMHPHSDLDSVEASRPGRGC